MTNAEREAYKALLWFAWKDGQCSLPDDPVELKALAGWHAKDRGDWVKVRRCFTPHPDAAGRIHNAVLLAEWQKARRIRALRKQAAIDRHHPKPVPVPVRASITAHPKDRLAGSFESVSKIADKVFPPQ